MGYYGVDWMQQQKHFIRALNLEKQMIAIILSLIIAVAAFNIVSMMVMVVTDKKVGYRHSKDYWNDAKTHCENIFLSGYKHWSDWNYSRHRSWVALGSKH
jgi:hypothetical protein